MKRLTPLQQRLCKLLGCEGLSVQDVSRKLGIPRATIYDHLKRIRKSFAELGLQYYLKH
jgi:RNA polymerase sigma-70 factor (ECF subfamily)